MISHFTPAYTNVVKFNLSELPRPLRRMLQPVNSNPFKHAKTFIEIEIAFTSKR